MFVDVKISWKLEVNSLAVTQHAVVRAALLVIGGVSLFFFSSSFFLFLTLKVQTVADSREHLIQQVNA